MKVVLALTDFFNKIKTSSSENESIVAKNLLNTFKNRLETYYNNYNSTSPYVEQTNIIIKKVLLDYINEIDKFGYAYCDYKKFSENLFKNIDNIHIDKMLRHVFEL